MVWLAVFAFIYGQRLWLEATLLTVLLPNNLKLHLLREAKSSGAVPVSPLFPCWIHGPTRRTRDWPPVDTWNSDILTVTLFNPGPKMNNR
jgi:hypothetical protein